MSQTEKVTLTGSYTHTTELPDGREHVHTFGPGSHHLPTHMAEAARIAGKVAPANAVRETPAPKPASTAPAAKKTR